LKPLTYREQAACNHFCTNNNTPSHTNLHSNGGTGFQPEQTQAEACGYQKSAYDCKLVSAESIRNISTPPSGKALKRDTAPCGEHRISQMVLVLRIYRVSGGPLSVNMDQTVLDAEERIYHNALGYASAKHHRDLGRTIGHFKPGGLHERTDNPQPAGESCACPGLYGGSAASGKFWRTGLTTKWQK
jgi:hypothetical protein